MPTWSIWTFRVTALLVALAPACTRRDETQEQPSPSPPPKPPSTFDPDGVDPKTLPQAQAIGAAIGSMAPSAMLGANASVSAGASVSAAPSTSASIAPSASGSTAASASASSSAASASASAQPPATREATLAQMIGAWGFARFDLDDAGTKTRWSAVPPDLQKEILKTAPEAWLFVGKDTMVTRLNGVPEKKSTYTVEAESAAFPKGTVVVKTNDEGRKAVRMLDPDTMRVEDLDKKDSFVTIFARKKVK
jgi:hypothetical protein